MVFTIPRVPGFRFNQDTPLTNASIAFNASVPTLFTRFPANFSFPASADLQVDTGSNFLPLTFRKLHATIYDLNTLKPVATGDLGHMTLPAKKLTTVFVPLNFSYTANNDSDQTCTVLLLSHPTFSTKLHDTTGNNWYNACKNAAIFTDGRRPRTSRPCLVQLVLSILSSHPIPAHS